jgi:hypothetical protein
MFNVEFFFFLQSGTINHCFTSYYMWHMSHKIQTLSWCGCEFVQGMLSQVYLWFLSTLTSWRYRRLKWVLCIHCTQRGIGTRCYPLHYPPEAVIKCGLNLSSPQVVHTSPLTSCDLVYMVRFHPFYTDCMKCISKGLCMVPTTLWITKSVYSDVVGCSIVQAPYLKENTAT